MKLVKPIVIWCLVIGGLAGYSQTVIPNASFENWTNFGNFSDPTGWDTPNTELMAIPFFGITVVDKSTDHYGSGSYSVKLETKHLSVPPMDVPGFMTCGKLVINLTSGSYNLSGGVPVTDFPTHLKGFFKYFPKGGDSCAIGIGLTKSTGSIVDTIGFGAFSTKDTISDWTPFSAWIDYISTMTPDTMNIVALSTAQETMTVGTALYVDELFLDYTTGFDPKDPKSGISIYNDLETKRLMIFLDFERPEHTTVRLINMMGREVADVQSGWLKSDRKVFPYAHLAKGIYLLEVLHNGKVFTKKFFLNP
jgi:hypothetical protein